MSDSLYELLAPHLATRGEKDTIKGTTNTEISTKYLSRLLSLRLSDLTTTEPQSISQANQSNHVSIQALSSRSHKTTTTSASHLSTLHSALPSITRNINEVREAIPALDESAVAFASTYSRTRDVENPVLQARRDSMLLSRQSDKLTDILELPSLLSTAITSAGTGTAGSANYSQALDLFAHIKRLSIIYPNSPLVTSIQHEAEDAMKSMTTNLLSSLRSQNIRLAAAIRTVGWLRRVVPDLSNQTKPSTATTTTGTTTDTKSAASLPSFTTNPPLPSDQSTQTEGSFGALFLVSRLHTFLTMTDALAPLRDLADQETERRLAVTNPSLSTPQPPPSQSLTSSTNTSTNTSRRVSTTTTTNPSNPSSTTHGTQTERYLKRYIEIFREQSFNTISMYRNIFPSEQNHHTTTTTTSFPPSSTSTSTSTNPPQPPSPQTNNESTTKSLTLTLPSALQQFPLHLVEILIEVLRTYLPNVTDAAARESLLMQVLYAANSLGRLGADFSMMISLLDDEGDGPVAGVGVVQAQGEEQNASAARTIDEEDDEEKEGTDGLDEKEAVAGTEPEWARIIKKHREQAARLDALASSQNQQSRKASDIAVR